MGIKNYILFRPIRMWHSQPITCIPVVGSRTHPTYFS